MDDCVFPIELIDAICKYDYRNWASLIRTCWVIYRALIGLRWVVKTSFVRTRAPANCFSNNYGITLTKGTLRRDIRARIYNDLCVISSICHSIDGAMVSYSHGESIYNSGDRKTITWCNNGCRIGEYRDDDKPGKRYLMRYHNVDECDTDAYTDRDKMKSILDSLGVKYVWLNYLPER